MTGTRRDFLGLAGLGLAVIPTESNVTIPPSLPVNRILCGGDVMLCRYIGISARRQKDPAAPLRDVAAEFSSADIAFVNLESPFSDKGKPVLHGMVFRAEPEMIATLENAGIDVVSTANNHARDCGSYGVEFTLDWLARHKIAAAGTGASAEQAHRGTVLERNGVRFGFLAYTYDQSNGNHKDHDDRIADMDVDAVAADVAGLLRRADVVMVSMHGGDEYQPHPNQEQRDFARAAIEAGAQVVIGHHPHVTQPEEAWKGGVIFYSLGNLVFDQFQRKETQHGLLAELFFVGRKLVRHNLIPVDLVHGFPRIRQQKS
ncbi:MAG: CapA family protein [Acidobacteriota bacterium]|nr:CapA family protein [Acidobacteriota bacterium]